MCNHMLHCSLCGLNWFVGGLLKEMLYFFILDIPGHQFLHLFCMKDCRLIGWYPLALAKLAFLVTGINVMLTCLQALGIYMFPSQALMCTYFWYHATDFDSLRTSCLFVSIITVWISMCTTIIEIFSNVVHWDTQAMPKSQVMKVLCITLLTHLFLKWLQVSWKICAPQP